MNYCYQFSSIVLLYLNHYLSWLFYESIAPCTNSRESLLDATISTPSPFASFFHLLRWSCRVSTKSSSFVSFVQRAFSHKLCGSLKCTEANCILSLLWFTFNSGVHIGHLQSSWLWHKWREIVRFDTDVPWPRSSVLLSLEVVLSSLGYVSSVSGIRY